ncbi:MAG: hypothetical protein ACRDDI_13615 [Aeromonas veronii]
MAGSSFTVQFKQQDLQGVISSLGALPKDIEQASRSAAKRALNMTLVAIRREVAFKLNISQKALKTRLTVRGAGPGTWILFFGVNRLPYDRTGNVDQNSYGMTHKTSDTKSGFVDNMGGSTKKGWIRKGRARQLGLKLPGLAGGKPDDGRLPILRIAHDLEAVATPIFERHQKRLSTLFAARFEHELKRIRGKAK